MDLKKEALNYHRKGRHGKIEVIPSKPCSTQSQLSLAYTPGVAEPCRKIQEDPDKAYCYTAKSNLVAVISNGTAVLGMGNIGALAGKPVMEGKGVLFKRFADIDVFDLEVNENDNDRFCQIVKALEPTFGGINLEDIKAPDCFYIEERLKQEMNIPVFHDDQHGTAIISAAALLNGLEIAGKKIEDIQVVISGAGAAGMACARLYIRLGVRPEKVIMVDSKGIIYKGRQQGMNAYKEEFAIETELRTLEEAMKGADVFSGLSVGGLLTPEMIKSMNDHPIVLAMANPDPEIDYPVAVAARPDVIMATGRSDYPNQVNNVLGFPFIFRGALDVRASAINEEMKIAAVKALADIAHLDVPDSVLKAYGLSRLEFGKEYIIPKPFDPRVLIKVASAVARAAEQSGVARVAIPDYEAYEDQLTNIIGDCNVLIRKVIHRLEKKLHSIVFPEGHEEKVLRAVHMMREENICRPVLLGQRETIYAALEKLHIPGNGIEIVDPEEDIDRLQRYTEKLYEKRKRKGVNLARAKNLLKRRLYYGSMMLDCGDADGMIAGITYSYPESVRPALRCIPLREGLTTVAGCYMVIANHRYYFFSDATVNIEPTAKQLAEIAVNTAAVARFFNIAPRVAFVSFSNFGSVNNEETYRIREALKLTREMDKDLMVDGEMQADLALNYELLQNDFAFSDLKKGANVLIFPNLSAANIAYKIVKTIGGAQLMGPILMGFSKPVNIMPRVCTVEDIVNIAAITALEIKISPL